MKIDCISENAKKEILSKIWISEYKEVMKYCLEGCSYEQIAEIVGYSVRHIERLVPMLWREVCISLAKEKVGEIL